MGAEVFFRESNGKTPEEAFEKGVNEALEEFGCRGYTGSLAEKQSYVLIDLPEKEDPYEFANKLIDQDDSRIDDKWGPAGCLDISETPHAFKAEGPVEEKSFLFFGWAST